MSSVCITEFEYTTVKTMRLMAPVYGAETTSNPRLVNVIADAKRAGFPKASIEAAIARGLGRSANGKPLETLSVEAIMPGNVGIIIECETDTRLGHQASIVSAIKKCGGTTSPSSFLFARRGRVVFDLGNKTFDDIFEQAIEASALDVSEEDGRVTVLTEPAETRRVAEALSESLGLDQNDLDTEIIWMANHDTESPLADSSAASQLSKLLDMVDDLDIHLQGVYANVAQGVLSEDMWSELRARITS